MVRQTHQQTNTLTKHLNVHAGDRCRFKFQNFLFNMHYSTFKLIFPEMKLFKIKAIKTYVNYVTAFVILHIVHTQTFKKMVSSQRSVQYSLKNLFEA